jgi:hypothetical protein
MARSSSAKKPPRTGHRLNRIEKHLTIKPAIVQHRHHSDRLQKLLFFFLLLLDTFSGSSSSSETRKKNSSARRTREEQGENRKTKLTGNITEENCNKIQMLP